MNFQLREQASKSDESLDGKRKKRADIPLLLFLHSFVSHPHSIKRQRLCLNIAASFAQQAVFPNNGNKVVNTGKNYILGGHNRVVNSSRAQSIHVDEFEKIY